MFIFVEAFFDFPPNFLPKIVAPNFPSSVPYSPVPILKLTFPAPILNPAPKVFEDEAGIYL